MYYQHSSDGSLGDSSLLTTINHNNTRSFHEQPAAGGSC